MATTLDNQQVSFTVGATLNGSVDLKSIQSTLNLVRSLSLTSGTGAGQADRIFDDKRNIAASGTDDLDLAGSLVDALGQTLTFARIKVIAVAAYATNTNNVIVGAAAANAFVGPFGASTHTVQVRPGGLLLFACQDTTGWAVTAGTGDLLRLANSAGGTSVDYDICIIGASA